MAFLGAFFGGGLQNQSSVKGIYMRGFLVSLISVTGVWSSFGVLL